MRICLFLTVSLAIVAWGCNPSSEYRPQSELKKAPALHDHDHDHDHGHEHGLGPHEGAVVEIGKDEYHGEIVLDDAGHALRFYVLDDEAKKPVGSKSTELTIETKTAALKLKAKPQNGDKEGESSRFELVDEAAVEALHQAGFLLGKTALDIGDKTFKIEIDAHFDGNDHDHHHGDEKKPNEAPMKSKSEPKPAEAKADDKPAAENKQAEPEASKSVDKPAEEKSKPVDEQPKSK